MAVAALNRSTTVEDLAAAFARTAARHDREASFPFENFARLHAAGLLALTVPTRFGGQGAGLAEACRVVGKIAAGEPSTALVLAMQYIQHVTIARSERFPGHLAERLAREAVARVSLVNALRVEPELGSPARGGLPATRARRTARGWRLSGRKIYSTGAPILTWYLVWAATEEAEPRVGHFLVPAGLSGTRIEPTWDHLGMRATGSHDVVFEAVEIPADHAVDVRPPAAWSTDPAQWAWNTLLIAALYDGVARAARAWLLAFLHQRRPTGLGASLATLPNVQSAVGAIESRLAVNARLLASAAAEVDRGGQVSVGELGLIKRAVTGHAVEAVEAALALTGNHGLSRRNPLERHYRDVLCSRIHTPQDDAVLATAGRVALGLA
jgi:alkylation response protein AidB-like acyl-CoA dehydrogenase